VRPPRISRPVATVFGTCLGRRYDHLIHSTLPPTLDPAFLIPASPPVTILIATGGGSADAVLS